MSKTLEQLRKDIDRIDSELLNLISQRARCAQEVAEVKQSGGEAVFYRPEREAQILRRILEENEGVMPAQEMARLFREIISACLALEQPLNIAFFGPAGSYTHGAALKHFGHSVNTMAVAAIDEVFREVEAGSAHYGVVPVENSTEGVVNHTLDTFIKSPLSICGEVELPIHHHLLSKADSLDAVKKIYSHPQSFAQCREWLNEKMAGVPHVVMGNNAEAARLAAEEEGAAAIAGSAAAELYGLNSLVSNIEDEPSNTTRFLIIGHQKPLPSGDDKTTLLISTSNQPGALYRALEPLHRHGVSMSRIESRPSRRGIWDYVFFIDLDGHADEAPISAALAELKSTNTMLRVLGAYPRAVL